MVLTLVSNPRKTGYNYCRKHRSLKGMTPAMAHGLTTEVWSVRELLQRISKGA